MQKDIAVLSLILVGAIAYLVSFSLGPPLYAKPEPQPVASAPCPDGGEAPAAAPSGGYGGEAGGYGGEAQEKPAAKPCPEEEAPKAGGEAGGYGGEAGGYGSGLGYL